MIGIVKPSTVFTIELFAPTSGVKEAASDVSVTCALLPTDPCTLEPHNKHTLVIVAVELVPAATPVIVTKPPPSIATEPDVTVPDQE